MSKLFRKTGLAVIVLALFASAMYSTPVRASEDSASSPEFQAIVGNDVFEITEGAVVYTAQPTADGLCRVDEKVGVGAMVPNDAPIEAVSISFEPNEQCEFVVTDISVTQATPGIDPAANLPEPPPAAAGTTIARVVNPAIYVNPPTVYDTQSSYTVYKGWTKGRMEEYVNIDTNRAYSEFRYFHWRDANGGYKVDRPHAFDGYCWSDSKYIWVNDRCEMKGYDQDPGQQWYESWSHFHSSVPPRPDYTLYETYFAQPTFWNYSCDIRQGVVPTGWDHRCQGGRKVISTGP